MRFKIGKDCVVDAAANQVMIKNGSGEKITRLEPRVMRVLTLLADRPGEVLTREFLIDAIWPNKFVGEEGLTQAISKLRKAFGDKARKPKFIETIPKSGYRIIADVERINVAAIHTFNNEQPRISRNRKPRFFTISSFAITAFVLFAALFLFHHF